MCNALLKLLRCPVSLMEPYSRGSLEDSPDLTGQYEKVCGIVWQWAALLARAVVVASNENASDWRLVLKRFRTSPQSGNGLDKFP